MGSEGEYIKACGRLHSRVYTVSKNSANIVISKQMVRQKKNAFVKVTLCNVIKMLTLSNKNLGEMLTNFNPFAGQTFYKLLHRHARLER